jgi:hypothetical protein
LHLNESPPINITHTLQRTTTPIVRFCISITARALSAMRVVPIQVSTLARAFRSARFPVALALRIEGLRKKQDPASGASQLKKGSSAYGAKHAWARFLRRSIPLTEPLFRTHTLLRIGRPAVHVQPNKAWLPISGSDLLNWFRPLRRSERLIRRLVKAEEA